MASTSSRPAPPVPLSIDEQEAVLRARLALNERSLRMLLKRITSTLSLDNGGGDGGDTSEEQAAAKAALCVDMESYTLGLRRLRGVSGRTTRDEVRLYTEDVRRMEAEHDATRQEIATLKHELAAVQQERKNKLEYDALASEIQRYDARDQLQSSLEGLRKDMDELEAERGQYEAVMARSQVNFGEIEAQLQALRADVGFEVGERERKEVQRVRPSDADAGGIEEEGDAVGASSREAAESSKSAKQKLNPSAAAFRPTSSATPPESRISSRASSPTRKRNRASRRTGMEEEEEEEEGDEREREAKRRAREEGETSEGDEEEEGAA